MQLEERPAPGVPGGAAASGSGGAVLIAHLSGDAGIVNTGELEHLVIKLTVRRPERLVMNLAGLAFLASLGVGLLLSLAEGVRRTGGTIAIAAPTPNVADVLTKMRIHAVIPVFATVEEALTGR